VWKSANVAFNPRFKRASLPFVRADDEDGVVAGDGADDLRPVFIVYRCGDRLGRAGGGDEDEQVGGLTGLEAEAAQDLADAGAFVVGGVGDGGQGVAVGALGEIELVNVARERGLGDVKATGGEFAAQFVLIGDGAGEQELADCGVALLLHLETLKELEKQMSINFRSTVLCSTLWARRTIAVLACLLPLNRIVVDPG
jgi:hypothetical protein